MSDITAERSVVPVEVARAKMRTMEPQFQRVLPDHIPVERFTRVALTAMQNNPDILKCTESSVWNACMRAAQDGLLPDGRDGAIVPYKGVAQWMPMIGGIRKKVRNSGEIATWEVNCVYEKDKFEFELGDEPFIRHAPALGDRGEIIAVYSIATLKDGSKSREVMSIYEIEAIRGKSKAANGPWNDPVFYSEMVRKTCARRHSKVLPMSSDLEDLIRREDHMYDLSPTQPGNVTAPPKTKQTLAGRLDTLAALPAPDTAPTQLPVKQRLLAELAEISTMKDCAHWLVSMNAIDGLTEADHTELSRALFKRQSEISKRAAPSEEPAKSAEETAPTTPKSSRGKGGKSPTGVKPEDALAAG